MVAGMVASRWVGTETTSTPANTEEMPLPTLQLRDSSRGRGEVSE